jgi:transposase
MTTMTQRTPERQVFAGVDTHADTHHAAVVDVLGRHLDDREFPATPVGYRALLAWIGLLGVIQAVGVEGTGAYGAELSRVLRAAGEVVIEVDRPDRSSRRAHGKTDPLDAYAAAQAVASGRAEGIPKSRDGIVESIRCLRVARRSAVKAKTQCINQIRAMLINGPAELREQMRALPTGKLIGALSRLRPGSDLSSPSAATKMALRSLARRHLTLTQELKELDAALAELTAMAVPGLLAKTGVGVDVAAQLLVTAGDNPGRLRSEASFAHLTGTAPIPASSAEPQKDCPKRTSCAASNEPSRARSTTKSPTSSKPKPPLDIYGSIPASAVSAADPSTIATSVTGASFVSGATPLFVRSRGGRQDARRDHPASWAPVGPPAEERMGDRGQQCGGEGEPGDGGVAVVPLVDEEGQQRWDHALVGVVDHV